MTNQMNKVIYLTDRTSEEIDELCGMKYWWFRLEGGKGVVPTTPPPYFIDGAALHNDLELYAKGRTVAQVVDSIGVIKGDQVELEKHWRRLGLVVAWGLYQEPYLDGVEEQVDCEAEVVLDRSPLWIAVTPDRIRRNKKTGRLIYREWKSTATIRREWQDHWTYAIQIHLGLKAVEEEKGEKFDYGQVTGFYKGTERGGRLVHPYVWAYYRNGEWSHTYKAGWDHRPVWEFPGGIVEWVKLLGADVAVSQFVYSSPVFLDERKVEEWIKVRIKRHEEIERFKQLGGEKGDVWREHFKPTSIHCRPPYGPPCEYIQACYNYPTQVDPVGSGAYIVRTPHHDLERIGVR